MQKVTIRLTDEQTAQLEQAARSQGRSKSSIVREIIDGCFVMPQSHPQSIESVFGSVPALGTESEDFDPEIEQAIGDAMDERYF